MQGLRSPVLHELETSWDLWRFKARAWICHLHAIVRFLSRRVAANIIIRILDCIHGFRHCLGQIAVNFLWNQTKEALMVTQRQWTHIIQLVRDCSLVESSSSICIRIKEPGPKLQDQFVNKSNRPCLSFSCIHISHFERMTMMPHDQTIFRPQSTFCSNRKQSGFQWMWRDGSWARLSIQLFSQQKPQPRTSLIAIQWPFHRLPILSRSRHQGSTNFGFSRLHAQWNHCIDPTSNPVASTNSDTWSHKIHELKPVCSSMHGFVDMYLHICITDCTIRKHVSSDAAAMNEITPSGSRVNAKQCSSSEYSIPQLAFFQNVMKSKDVFDQQRGSLIDPALWSTINCSSASLACAQHLKIFQLEDKPAECHGLKNTFESACASTCGFQGFQQVIEIRLIVRKHQTNAASRLHEKQHTVCTFYKSWRSFAVEVVSNDNHASAHGVTIQDSSNALPIARPVSNDHRPFLQCPLQLCLTFFSPQEIWPISNCKNVSRLTIVDKSIVHFSRTRIRSLNNVMVNLRNFQLGFKVRNQGI